MEQRLFVKIQEEYIIQESETSRQVTKNCPDCQRNKTNRHKPYGELQPVELASCHMVLDRGTFIVNVTKSQEMSPMSDC